MQQVKYCLSVFDNWVLFKVEGRGIKQDLIPYVGQLILPMLLLEGWIIDPDVNSLLDGPCDVECLPIHYGEVVHTDVITHDIGMFIDRGGVPEVFPVPFPKRSLQIPLCTPHHNPVCHMHSFRLHFCVM